MGNHVLVANNNKTSIINAFYGIRWGNGKIRYNSPTLSLFV